MQRAIHKDYHHSDLLDCARGVLSRAEIHNATAIDAACEIVLEMSTDQVEIIAANFVLETLDTLEPSA